MAAVLLTAYLPANTVLAEESDSTSDALAPEQVITEEPISEKDTVTQEIESEEEDQERQTKISENPYEMSVSSENKDDNSSASNVMEISDRNASKAVKMPDQAIAFDDVYNDEFRAIPSEKNNGLYYYNNHKIYFYSLADNTVREVYSYSDIGVEIQNQEKNYLMNLIR